MQNKRTLRIWFARIIGIILPLQTVFIIHQAIVGGEVWQWGGERVYVSLVIGVMYCLWRVLGQTPSSSPYDKGENRAVAEGMTVTIVLSIILAIAQVVTGHEGRSVLLGISEQNAEMPGAFVAVIHGMRVLRGSGIFQHPNIYGAWCAVLVWWAMQQESRVRWIVGSIGVLGVMLSMSRTALLMLAIVGLLTYGWKKAILWLTPIVIALGIRMMDSRSITGIMERWGLLSEWWTVFKSSWLWGTGIGRYTYRLLELYPDKTGFQLQPVHNTVLLILAELGVVKVVLLGVVGKWIPAFARMTGMKKWVVLVPAVVFDHFLWTTYSGFLIVVYIALTVWGRAYKISVPTRIAEGNITL